MGFDESPLLVIWETTQACDLACVRCRPSASPRRHASELSTEEAHCLLETVREFGDPLMVFTGGDPLKRPDLLALLGRSAELGLRTTVRPSSTPLLNKQTVRDFYNRGVTRMSIGVDGPDPETHDALRGASGSFAIGVAALEEAQRVGLETQIHTTLNARNRRAIRDIAGLAARVGVRLWSVHAPASQGRAAREEFELAAVSTQISDISRSAPFQISLNGDDLFRSSDRRGGSVFISHTGEIYPCGFLPISAGNVRFDSLLRVYRKSPLFREFHGLDVRHGKCGFCEFREPVPTSLARVA